MLKSTVVTIFSAVLLLSLMCSLSLQESRAEMTVAESADQITPLKSGAQAPSFVVLDADGNDFAFDPDALNRPTVLITFRGGWCPFCNLELQALQALLPEIKALGANLIGISPETPDTSMTTVEKQQLQFDVLSDVGNNTARDYGLIFTVYEEMRPLYLKWGLDVPASNGDDSWELPVPATYVIDTNGVARTAHVDKDYTKRMEPEQVLTALRNLKV